MRTIVANTAVGFDPKIFPTLNERLLQKIINPISKREREIEAKYMYNGPVHHKGMLESQN